MTCKSGRAGLGAVAFLSALLTPFATVAHLAYEAASLGANSPQILFSAEHAYLGVLNAIALLALAAALGPRKCSAERRRRIALLVAALPGRGRGWRFLTAATFSQLAFFAITQLLEGDPMARGHVIFGLLAAIVVSIVGALIVAACKLRILRILANVLVLPNVAPSPILASSKPFVALPQRIFWSPSVSNRPPPLSAS